MILLYLSNLRLQLYRFMEQRTWYFFKNTIVYKIFAGDECLNIQSSSLKQN